MICSDRSGRANESHPDVAEKRQLRLKVETHPDEIAEFVAALPQTTADRQTFSDTDGKVLIPLTFPTRWFAAPELRAAVDDLIGAPDALLVHESQNFDYRRALAAGTQYALEITLWRDEARAWRDGTRSLRLSLQGALVDGTGAVIATVETTLRVLARESRSARSGAERAV